MFSAPMPHVTISTPALKCYYNFVFDVSYVGLIRLLLLKFLVIPFLNTMKLFSAAARIERTRLSVIFEPLTYNGILIHFIIRESQRG